MLKIYAASRPVSPPQSNVREAPTTFVWFNNVTGDNAQVYTLGNNKTGDKIHQPTATVHGNKFGNNLLWVDGPVVPGDTKNFFSRR